MTTDLARQDATPRDIATADREQAAGALAHVLGTGDLYQLTNEQRVAHYLNLCSSLGLNALSRPFQWIEFKDGDNSPAVLTLYFKPSGAAQMLRNHQISFHFPRKEIVGELFVVEVEGMAPNGRKGSATKYVPLTNRYGKLTGNRLSNAFMAAESGALRRLALNMFGLSTGPDLDEAFSARPVIVDARGNVLDEPTEEQRYLAENPAAARAIGEPTFETVHNADMSPLAATASQAPRAEELERPSAPTTRTVLGRASDEDVKRWLGAWFAAVKGLSLDTDEARHQYVAQWTADEWPKLKRTDSLRTAFGRMTPEEAGEFLAHVRALMDDERRELLAWRDEDGNEAGADVGLTPEEAHAEAVRQRDPSIVPPRGDRVRDSVLLTGGPPDAGDESDETLAF